MKVERINLRPESIQEMIKKLDGFAIEIAIADVMEALATTRITKPLVKKSLKISSFKDAKVKALDTTWTSALNGCAVQGMITFASDEKEIYCAVEFALDAWGRDGSWGLWCDRNIIMAIRKLAKFLFPKEVKE